MTKAIFVLDMPDVCGVCELCVRQQTIVVDMPDEQYENSFCGLKKIRVNISGKPRCCPLKPMPEKKTCGEYEQYSPGYAWYSKGLDAGFNYCIDEIEGKEE